MKDSDGRVFICAEKYNLPDIIRELKDGWKYCFYYGHRLESGMSEEEIYKIIYGSKERYKRIFPNEFFEREDIEKKKKIDLDIFLETIKDVNPKVYNEVLRMKRENEPFDVDPVILQLLLDLNAKATLEEISYILSVHGSSGYAHSYYASSLYQLSSRGKELLEYLINEKGFKLYKKYIDDDSKKTK